MSAVYLCRCGHEFPEELGKYGCPNCCGDSGPAKLINQEELTQMTYLISLTHHTIAKSRTVRYEGSLQGAKLRAAKEFGDDFGHYTILIEDEALGYGGTVAQRRVDDARWYTVQ